MRYAAAYLLSILGGNRTPNLADIAKILNSVGIECDTERAQKIVDACEGKDADEIIAAGLEKLDNMQLMNKPPVDILPMGPLKQVSSEPEKPGNHDTATIEPPPSPDPEDSFLGLFD